MKITLTILLTLMIFGHQANAQQTNGQSKTLYPIMENGLWGFIDKSGQVIIEPKFRSAGQFSEGLAPVRLNGTYGFIDMTGNFVIQPKYDVAYPFEQEQAMIYIDGKPYYIDKNGKTTFEHNFTKIYGFGEHDYSIVRTTSKKYGVINKQGTLQVDTIFKKIEPFSDGLAIAIGMNHAPYSKDKKISPVFEIGVINPDGDFIIPFGRYQYISEFRNGFAKVKLDVERQKGYYDREGIVDSNGDLRFKIPARKWRFDYGNENFSEGLATVDIYFVDPNTIKVWSSKDRNSYKGVINYDGKVVFSNKDWDEISPFKHGRAFIQDINKNWYLIDKTGEILNEQPYQNILYKVHNGNPEYLFQNGIQFVETDKGWGVIDTTGKFVIEPKEMDFGSQDMYSRGPIIFTREYLNFASHNYSYRYGFWNIKTGTVVNPQFHDINISEFTSDLIYVMQDDLTGYIDHLGNYVWRENKDGQHKQGGLNIDYMNRGYFYASSPYKEELAGFGGWGGSKNNFSRIYKPKKFKQDQLNMVIQPNKEEKYKEAYAGMKMFVANTSKDTLYFDAQDSRLYLKIQAMDKYGQWKDIEYLPSSWCGNSYHSLFLPPNNNWEFVIPKYEGEFKTKLRAKLLYKTSSDQKEDHVIYSNEFDGSINPGQFWRKRPYYPSGLMDPYND